MLDENQSANYLCRWQSGQRRDVNARADPLLDIKAKWFRPVTKSRQD